MREMNNTNNYIKNIKNFTKTNEPKPENGSHIIGIYIHDDEKYLLKNPSSHIHYANEFYILKLIEEILRKENSTQSVLVEDKNNWKIASKFIKNTQNLYQFLEENEYKTTKQQISRSPKNLISIMIMNIILNNINGHPANIIIDQDNKFYLIDPMVLSQNNVFGINVNIIKTKINNLYDEFIKSKNKQNLKKNLIKLFIFCYETYNNLYYRPLLKWMESNFSNEITDKNNIASDYVKKNNSKNKIPELKGIIKKNQLMIDKYLNFFINSISDKDILAEISIIKGVDDKQKENIRKLSDYFESEENFPGFGQSGIETGYANEMIKRIEQLESLKLSDLSIEKNHNLRVTSKL